MQLTESGLVNINFKFKCSQAGGKIQDHKTNVIVGTISVNSP